MIAYSGDQAERYGQQDGCNGGQGHSPQRYSADGDAGGGNAQAKDDGSQHEVDWIVVVDMAFH